MLLFNQQKIRWLICHSGNSILIMYCMNNIQHVSDSYLCSNCGACAAACPKDAIDFEYSSVGRLAAKVNNKCIDCGICNKVCPSVDSIQLHLRNEDKYHGNILSVKVGRANDETLFSNAQSGGAIAAILHYLFKKGKIDAAIVCRMETADIPQCKGQIITSVLEILSTQKSCYTPVELLSCLRNAKQYQSIAVVGLPCQIQGATSLVEVLKSYKNIKYKLGLICDRTLCATLMHTIKSYTSFKGNIRIDWRRKDFSFKGKHYPYKTAPIVVYDNNGCMTVLENKFRFALKDFFTAPRCRVCFDKMNTFSDIVCGDPWGMNDIDWNRGESLIITRTKLGDQLIKEIILEGAMILRDASYEEVIVGQHLSRKKEQISYYSRAAETLPNKIESYLYSQDKSPSTNHMQKKAEKEFSDFINRENYSKEEVVRAARMVVAAYDRQIKLNGKLLYRLNSKLKRIFFK